MASDNNEASCESDPNFAVICAFMEKFGVTCGLASIDFLELQEMLENTQEVPQELIDLHIKLLRKSKKTVSNERWEKAIIKFCHTFCVQDAWEIERFGYKKARLSSKLRVLKELLEMQFDYNAKFKAEINKMSAEELRSQPLGKDKHGHAYWFQNDNNCQIRVYKEDPDEETWTLVAKDRDGLMVLINELSNGDSKISSESITNEDDSNSLAEKPIIDTGQVDSSSSDSNKKNLAESENSNESKKADSEGSDDAKKPSPAPLQEEADDLSAKRPMKASENGENLTKKIKLDVSKNGNETADEEKTIVSEAIEEPVMLVKGDGFGVENQGVNNPIVGEEIVEETMYFYGVGSGVDCKTGNEEKSSSDTKKSEDSAGDSGVLNEQKSETKVSINSDSKNCIVNLSVINSKNDDNTDGPSKEVPTSPVKSPYKLGTIIDTKTDNKFFNTISKSPTKKSRWDVETIMTEDNNTSPKINCESSSANDLINNKKEEVEGAQVTSEVTTPKKSMFFFGPGCLQFSPVSCTSATIGFGQKVPQLNLDEKIVESQKNENQQMIITNTKGDIGYRISQDSEDHKIVKQNEIDDITPSDKSEKSATETENIIENKSESTECSVKEINNKNKSEVIESLENTNEPETQSIPEERLNDKQTPINDETVGNPENINTEKLVIHDKNSNLSIKPSDELENIQSNNLSELEKDIIHNEDHVSEEYKIPEVTAALSGCEELIPKENIQEKEELNISVCDDKPIPIVEELCVKKDAYLVGQEKTKVEEEDNEKSSVDKEVTVDPIVRQQTENQEVELANELPTEEKIEKTDDTLSETVKESLEIPNNEKEETEEQSESTNVMVNDNMENKEAKVELSQSDSEKTTFDNDKIVNSQEPDLCELSSGKEKHIVEEQSEGTKSHDNVNFEESNIVPRVTSESSEVTNKKEDEIFEEITKPKNKDILEEAVESRDSTTLEEPTKLNDNDTLEVTEEQIESTNLVENKEKDKESFKSDLEDKTSDHNTIIEGQENDLTDEVQEKKIIEKSNVEAVIEESRSFTETASLPIEANESSENAENSIRQEPKFNENIEKEIENSFESTKETNKEVEKDKDDDDDDDDITEIPNIQDSIVVDSSSDSSNDVVELAPDDPLCISDDDNKDPIEELSEECTVEPTEKLTDHPTVEPTEQTKKQIEEPNEEQIEKQMKEPIEVNIEKQMKEPVEVGIEKQMEEPIEVGIKKQMEESIEEQAEKRTEEPATELTKESIEKPAMSLLNFSLDFNETATSPPPASPEGPRTRSGLRKRGRESPRNVKDLEETPEKRIKMKGKRTVDAKLRKTIEEQKKIDLISSDDDNNAKNDDTIEEKKNNQKKKSTKKKKGSKKKRKPPPFVKKTDTVIVSSDADGTTERPANEEQQPAQKKSKANRNKRLLSNLGIDPDQPIDLENEANVIGVRQSRRIAQLKIKEEAMRRKLEEEMVQDFTKSKKKSKKQEDKDYKVEKKKSKNDAVDDDEEDDSTDSKKKKKKKKKRRKFDEYNPWRSSSDSSTTAEEEEEEMAEEEEDEELPYVSDHEFSPESDLEGDGEWLPLKRARTVRKESDVEDEVDDCPCQKCGKSDHPEWILLCDRCDNGWHCSCLRPPLLVIPEGDWFCPPCQHVTLLNKLQEKLGEYDKKLSKKEIEDRRKQRLAYIGISLNNVLPTKDTEVIKKRRRNSKDVDEEGDDDDEDDDDNNDGDEGDEAEVDDESSSDESESGSATESETGSDSDEPIYQLRQRRQAHSYRFNDYDELINSAIQDEMEAVKGAGNQGRGKDIATIVNAEKEDERKKESEGCDNDVISEQPDTLPPVVPINDKDKEPKPVYSDDEPIQVRKKLIGRKKHRKLNSLDISSEDEDSDEDFKGTSSESDDDFEEDLGSEDSEDLDSGRGRRRGGDPVRRSTRARTSRYDADFIDDGETESEDEAPRRKKKRSIWDESESEESDRSWGRRKKKPANRSNRSKRTINTSSTSVTKKKKTKKKKKDEDSDAEVYKKKKPKIKFGMDGDFEGPGRRTRGKKINYVDALGSDSEEDRIKRPPPRIESEEEYVVNEDDDVNEDDKVSDEGGAENGNHPKAPKIQIQSYTDARFTQLLPEGVPTPRNLEEDGDDEPNPIDQINRNLEAMDENEMEKMMEEEEYANKQLQLVALQIEKEKKRKEREAKRMEVAIAAPQLVPQDLAAQKKRGRKPKNFFPDSLQEPLVGNVDNLIVNSENNDELSEPPGVSLPLFDDLGNSNDALDDSNKKRSRGRNKKSLEETVANLGSARQQPEFMGLVHKTLPTDLSTHESNIEIATPPQPFSQSQPTPSVITRMLQSKPGQPGYPVGTIRPKQFAAMPDREEEVPTSLAVSSGAPMHPFIQGGALRSQLSSPYRQIPPNLNHYPRGVLPPHQLRQPVPISSPIPPHIYHSHRPLDPSPSGGGPINITNPNSPNRVVSPAASSPGSNKNETPPPPYSRSPIGRFPPLISTNATGPRHLQHLQASRPNLTPYPPTMPPSYHYGQFPPPSLGGGGSGDEAIPTAVYENSPYSEQFTNEGGENSNSKPFDEESGGEFGGLVSYFSSQREDDLES